MKARLGDEIGMRNLLFDHSRDGIVILDENGKLFKANKQFADMLGYTMEEIEGLHVWDWDDLYSKEQLLKMAQPVDPDGVQFQT